MTGASRVSRSIAGLTGWYSSGSVRVRDSGQRAGEAAEARHSTVDSARTAQTNRDMMAPSPGAHVPVTRTPHNGIARRLSVRLLALHTYFAAASTSLNATTRIRTYGEDLPLNLPACSEGGHARAQQPRARATRPRPPVLPRERRSGAPPWGKRLSAHVCGEMRDYRDGDHARMDGRGSCLVCGPAPVRDVQRTEAG